jgi:hypothetical protein
MLEAGRGGKVVGFPGAKNPMTSWMARLDATLREMESLGHRLAVMDQSSDKGSPEVANDRYLLLELMSDLKGLPSASPSGSIEQLDQLLEVQRAQAVVEQRLREVDYQVCRLCEDESSERRDAPVGSYHLRVRSLRLLDAVGSLRSVLRRQIGGSPGFSSGSA